MKLSLSEQSLCTRRGCCWSPLNDTSVPWCFFSSDHGYQVEGALRPTQEGESALQLRSQEHADFHFNTTVLFDFGLFYFIL